LPVLKPSHSLPGANVETTKEPAVKTGQPRVFRPMVTPPPLRDSVRVRIVQKGWETFTGNFGQIDFLNGVSVSATTEVAADRITTQILCVDAETGEPLGPGARAVGTKTIKAPVLVPSEISTKTPEDEHRDRLKAEETRKIETAKAGRQIYTQTELEDVVDKNGIAGLREIGQQYGVKGRAIPELMASILAAQAAEHGRAVISPR